jgi:Tol biopolymer transport system component/dienelactone hydrolase
MNPGLNICSSSILTALDYSRRKWLCLFSYKENGSFILQTYNTITEKLEVIYSSEGYCRGVRFSPDGESAILNLGSKNRSDGSLKLFSFTNKSISNLVENVGDRTYFTWSPDGNSFFFVNKFTSLAKLTLASNQIDTIHTAKDVIWGLAISPDAGELVFSTGAYGKLALNVYSFASNTVSQVAHNCSTIFPHSITDNAFSPDGKFFCFAGISEDNFNLALLSMTDQSIEWIKKTSNLKIPDSFSPSGSKLIYTEMEGARYALKILCMNNGSSIDFSATDTRNYGQSYWLSDDAIISNTIDFNTRQEFWTTYISDKSSRKIDQLSHKPIEGYVVPEEISYKSFDGEQIKALFFPSRRKSTKSIIALHGGPQMHRYIAPDNFSQLLAQDGFNVLWPDYRGSSGDGIRFERLNDGDLGGGDVKDVLWGSKWLQENGFSLPSTTGILGSSYGGYLTLQSLGIYPDEWKAGVSISALWDLERTYYAEHAAIKKFLDDKLGSPVENAKLYHDRSPINHLWKVKADCMIVHGRHDLRCPIDELGRVKELLGERCIEVVIYEDEGHSILKQLNRKDMDRRMLTFFKATL